MATHTLSYGIGGSGITQSQNVSNTQVGVAILDGEPVATGTTNFVVAFVLDVSTVKSFYLNSDQDILLDTNVDAPTEGVDGDVISLLANVPYVWAAPGGVVNDAYDTFLLTVDVTDFRFTNASGSTATVDCVALYDASVA